MNSVDNFREMSRENRETDEDVYFSEGEEPLIKILDLKKSKMLCDIVIISGKSVVHAHSCVLAARSSFFLNFLLNFSDFEWSIKRPLELNICHITKYKEDESEMNCMTCASRIVDFLYCGQIVVNESHIKHLMNISYNLELKCLIEVCEKFLRDKGITYVGQLEYISPKEEKITTEINENVTSGPFNEVKATEEKKSGETANPLNRSNDLFKTVQSDSTYGECDCKECHLQFNSLKMLDTHRKIFHAKDFICLSCGYKTFKLSYFLFHLINMEHEENTCSICLFETPDRGSLIEHFDDHKCDLPFKCYNCGTLFKVRKEWQQHMLCHKNLSSKNESFFEGKDIFKSGTLTCNKKSANYVCEVCGFRALYKSTFERHISKHKEETELFTCSVAACSFSSRYKYNLKEHMLKHNDSKQFSCDLCALKFSQERNLKRHIQTVHNKQYSVYNCSRCDYKNARVDKAKAHCEMYHPSDSDALRFILEQHDAKKSSFIQKPKRRAQKVNLKPSDSATESDVSQNNSGERVLPKENIEPSFRSSDLSNEGPHKNVKKSYILSETTGEFNIISENEGEQVPVASVTSTNVLTIGNFRKGTGSVTLNETTGVLTFNNINSESTGAVFLNESTGELSYINLGKESVNMDIGNNFEKTSEFQAQLNELSDINDDDFLFDSFEMDIANEDSCDGFDDVDGLLFDPIEVGDTEHLELFVSNTEEESPKVIPHLNETTGELSFDYIESQKSAYNAWQSSQSSFGKEVNLEENTDNSYRLLLNEVTGEFS